MDLKPDEDASDRLVKVSVRPECFSGGIEATVLWYLDHGDWVGDVTSGAYRDWVAEQYA